MTATTTSYGNWTTVKPNNICVEDTIEDALGEFAGDYNLDGIARDYRAAINASLPDGISLRGNEFHGPVNVEDRAGLRRMLPELVEGIDILACADRHHKTV